MKDDNQYRSQILLKKYLSGKCTEEEKAQVEQWYLDINDQPIDLQTGELKEDLEYLRMGSKRIPAMAYSRRMWIYSAAASIVVVLTMSILWEVNRQQELKEKLELVSRSSDVMPGANRAILSFDNGQGIELSGLQEELVSDGQSFVYGDGSEVKQMDQIRIATVSTPVAGQYQVTLPDGTRVWLNALSSITYPSDFGIGERKVKVSGEVYMEVKRDEKRPFVVDVNNQRIEVLGTSFNLEAYGEDEAIHTTLVEGSLRVHHKAINTSATLKPGQQATIIPNQQIQVKEVDALEIAAWKDGLYMIKNEQLSVYAKKIQRWYDVEVDMGEYGDKKLSAIIPRNAHLSAVLQAIELKTGVKFKIEGRRVTTVK